MVHRLHRRCNLCDLDDERVVDIHLDSASPKLDRNQPRLPATRNSRQRARRKYAELLHCWSCFISNALELERRSRSWMGLSFHPPLDFLRSIAANRGNLVCGRRHYPSPPHDWPLLQMRIQPGRTCRQMSRMRARKSRWEKTPSLSQDFRNEAAPASKPHKMIPLPLRHLPRHAERDKPIPRRPLLR